MFHGISFSSAMNIFRHDLLEMQLKFFSPTEMLMITCDITRNQLPQS